MYKLAIFDLDGTLLNTIGDLAAAGNYTLEKMGFPQHSEEKFRQFVGNGIPKLIERMLPEKVREESVQDTALKIFMEYYSQHNCDLTKPYPGIPELILRLRERGVSCGANSNKAHEFTQELIQRNFGEAITEVIGYGGGFQPKPDPGAALEIIRRTGVKPEETLYIGDSEVDISTGKNAGTAVCAVLWGFRSSEELSAGNPDFMVRSTEELEKIILG